MIRPFDEPATEDEAQELKRFLEQGAEVGLEEVQQHEASPTTLRTPDSVVMIFPGTEDLLGEITAEDSETELLLSLDFSEISEAPTFSVGLFLGTPEADAFTSFDTPGFVGSVSFFCHSEDRDGVLVCVNHGAGPTRFRVPISDALERDDPGEISLTLVPIPGPGEELIPLSLEVAASIDVVRSTVRPAS